MPEDLLIMGLEEFLEWFEDKLYEKYESSLDSLKDRFYGIYLLVKKLAEKVIEVENIVNSSDNPPKGYKALTDNMLRIIHLILKEFPVRFDTDIVKQFFSSFAERIKLLFTHAHQIVHLSFDEEFSKTEIGPFLRKKMYVER